MPIEYDDPAEMAEDLKRIYESDEIERLVGLRLPNKGKSLEEICRRGRESADKDESLSRLVL